MGNTKGDFETTIELVTKQNLQIRHNALEAFRVSANNNLVKKVGKKNFYFKLKLYPHQVIRHNPTANFAGADRFSDGMKHSFGKPLGRAAVVKKGQVIAFIKVNKEHILKAKKAFKVSSQRLPCQCSINIKQ
jgi:large subunit ribosomal protein L10e